MKVVSINIAQPTLVEYLGKQVSTGIFKQAVKHRVYGDKVNMAGDGQADLIHHGGTHKAVYGFSSDHYSYWRETLDRPELSYGVFGENLTISSLSEAQLCIGDQLVIGDTVLEVSQPRVPCFKLGIALDNKKIPNLFTKSYATGIYFRVIKQGYISPEDLVIVNKTVSKTVSVQALFRAYYDRSYADAIAVLTIAADIKALAPEWHEKVLKKLAKKQ